MSPARRLLGWAAIVLGIGLLLFAYRYLAVLADGAVVPLRKPLIEELTAAFGAGVLYFGVRWLVRRYPLTAGSWLRRLPLYVAALVPFSFLHTSLNWGLRELLFRLAGLGDYHYGIMPLRYAMELQIDVIIFVGMVGVLHAVARLQAARAQQLRAARLEGSLARAQLRNLSLQLQPHFLFNALNTISSVMYDDPEAADEMLDRLAELLRAALRTARTDEVPLVAELALLDSYLEIMRGRFGDRLAVTVEVEPAARGVAVPALVLQPLVENAIRHGGVEKSGSGTIEIAARRSGDRLRLTVADDGPGAAAGSAGSGAARTEAGGGGLGLSATAERLALLYGEGASFVAGGRPEGGFRVTVELPWRPAAEGTETALEAGAG